MITYIFFIGNVCYKIGYVERLHDILIRDRISKLIDYVVGLAMRCTYAATSLV